jgi:hypothetical protein
MEKHSGHITIIRMSIFQLLGYATGDVKRGRLNIASERAPERPGRIPSGTIVVHVRTRAID